MFIGVHWAFVLYYEGLDQDDTGGSGERTETEI